MAECQEIIKTKNYDLRTVHNIFDYHLMSKTFVESQAVAIYSTTEYFAHDL